MADFHDHPVVVGVDGSDESLEAVRWAAAEAARRDRAVALIYARPRPVPAGADGSGANLESSDMLRLDAGAVMARAAAVLREIAPELPFEHLTTVGRAAQILIDSSEGAALLVVGHRGRDATALLLGSVVARLAAHAYCPVVVVRRRPADAEVERGLVVVGTDGSLGSDAAVGFAFEEAGLRGGAVAVLHAWEPPAASLWRSAVARQEDAAEAETAQVHLVREWIHPWQDKYPHVPVSVRLTSDSPTTALVGAASRAELLVVGSRGHGGFLGLLIGSVSQHVIHRAAGPVAVVR